MADTPGFMLAGNCNEPNHAVNYYGDTQPSEEGSGSPDDIGNSKKGLEQHKLFEIG